MKRLLGIAVILASVLLLFGCGTKTQATATFTVGEDGITTDGITFSITIDDPEGEITGTVTVRLYDEDENEITSKAIAGEEDWENITFSGLENDVTYTLKVHATMGRNTAVIGEKTFRPLSTATNEITTTDEFLAMKDNRSGTYVLKNDLDFTDVEFTSPFTSSFSGSFDGGGFALRNITFTKVNSYTGVFGYIASGTVKNLTLDNVSIGTAEEPLLMATSSRVGILAGYISSTSAVIEDITITNSSINYSSSSTVQAYVGAIAGENRGSVTGVSIVDTTVSLTGTSHGKIKVGGAVGMLYEGATLREVGSEADVTFELAATPHREVDRDFNILVGGLIGDNAAINISDAVDNVWSTGNVTVTNLDFNTDPENTAGRYVVYVGGLAGSSNAVLSNAFYGGSISLDHQKNDHDDDVVKVFSVGGLVGYYLSRYQSANLVRMGDGQTITVTVSDDVNITLSQLAGHTSGVGTLEASVFGETHLELNGVSKTAEDNVTVITDITGVFDTWAEEAWQAVYPQ
jgi:hypothetical protein